jgi:hypothetical protein
MVTTTGMRTKDYGPRVICRIDLNRREQVQTRPVYASRKHTKRRRQLREDPEILLNKHLNKNCRSLDTRI